MKFRIRLILQHQVGSFVKEILRHQAVYVIEMLLWFARPTRFQGLTNNNEMTTPASKHFLRLPGNGGVYESQDCTDVTTTLFSPLQHDVMINLRSIEQLSFATGVFFVADASGVYERKAEGCIVNLWRYNESERRIYISRSLLITDQQVSDHRTNSWLKLSYVVLNCRHWFAGARSGSKSTGQCLIMFRQTFLQSNKFSVL